jgi:voltage-dependent anion channel protein 2
LLDVSRQLDKSASIKAKINNAGVIGLGEYFYCEMPVISLNNHNLLGYTQTLRPGIKASFALALDTQKLNDPAPMGPAHKVSSCSIACSILKLK